MLKSEERISWGHWSSEISIHAEHGDAPEHPLKGSAGDTGLRKSVFMLDIKQLGILVFRNQYSC